MFNLFKLFKKNGKKKSYVLVDMNGLSIEVGDKVEALRYELGVCIVANGGQGIVYRSEETGKEVSFAKMIDAHTKYQKVRKLD